MAKDLYAILQVAQSATAVEIKKAYRKLALQYHPDKNPNNEYATIRFSEIKSAYEVLINNDKRNDYNRQIWQEQRAGEKEADAITPLEILQKTTILAKHVSTIDVFRMSQKALYFQIIEILCDRNLKLLQYFDDQALNQKIVETILVIVKPLNFYNIKKLESVLIQIAGTDNKTIQQIHQIIQDKKRLAFWEKYNILIILIITTLICCAIFLIGK